MHVSSFYDNGSTYAPIGSHVAPIKSTCCGAGSPVCTESGNTTGLFAMTLLDGSWCADKNTEAAEKHIHPETGPPCLAHRDVVT